MNEEPNTLIPAAANPCRDPPDGRGLVPIVWQIITAAQAAPLLPPRLPADLAQMPALLRIHACLRLFVLDLEFALSPGGQLRGVGKICCRISVALAILALCLASILGCVALVLTLVLVVTQQLVLIFGKLLQIALLMLGLLAAGAALLFVAKVFSKSSSSAGAATSASHAIRRR